MRSVYLVALLALCGTVEGAPTFSKDIAPILFQNCSSCHRPGQVAPFSLLTYQDAAKRAPLIAAVTTNHYMPPWKAEPGYGHFTGERRLSAENIRLISEWVKSGAPEGDPKDLPSAPVYKSEWSAGKPDLELAMAAPFDIPADGPDRFQCFVLPYRGDAEQFVKSVEFRPGNARVDHHALLFVDTSGEAKRLDQQTPEQGYSCFGGPGFIPAHSAGGWAPGAIPTQFPEGAAIPIPKGADVVIQIHFHPSGKPEHDQSSIGLRFTGPPSVGVASVIALSRKIDIPPGDAHYEVKSSVIVPESVKAIGITPHAHYLCKEMKVTAYLPDGAETPLIWIKDWDFNWQGQYRFADPVPLPKGTRVAFDYVYDNSSNNPHNPSNPPRRVTYGEQTTNEMALVFLMVTMPDPAQVPQFRRELMINLLDQALSEGVDVSHIDPARAERIQTLIRLFDRNGNGVLEPEEREALIRFLRKRALM